MDRKTQTGGSALGDTMMVTSDGDRRLRDVVETEIIPRLVHAHTKPRDSSAPEQLVAPAEIDALESSPLERLSLIHTRSCRRIERGKTWLTQ